MIHALEAFETRSRDKTVEFQNDLLCRGRAGQLAFGLFRAQKRSTLAKTYRRHNDRQSSYDGKNEALQYLDAVLSRWGAAMKIEWGWQVDRKTEVHQHVLYVQLTDKRQCSFHSGKCYSEKAFPDQWIPKPPVVDTVLWYCDAVLARVEPGLGLRPDDLMPFGKHVGKPIDSLDPRYYDWLNDWDGLQQWTCLEQVMNGIGFESEDAIELDKQLDAVLARSICDDGSFS